MLDYSCFLFFLLVDLFNLCGHWYDAALVPDALEDISLLAIILLEIHIFGTWYLRRSLFKVINSDLNLLEHIGYNEHDFL